MAKELIYKPGDLPDCCTETIVSNHEYLVVREEFVGENPLCGVVYFRQIYFVYKPFTCIGKVFFVALFLGIKLVFVDSCIFNNK